jgi:hypothetical protein
MREGASFWKFVVTKYSLAVRSMQRCRATCLLAVILGSFHANQRITVGSRTPRDHAALRLWSQGSDSACSIEKQPQDGPDLLAPYLPLTDSPRCSVVPPYPVLAVCHRKRYQ